MLTNAGNCRPMTCDRKGDGACTKPHHSFPEKEIPLASDVIKTETPVNVRDNALRRALNQMNALRNYWRIFHYFDASNWTPRPVIFINSDL